MTTAAREAGALAESTQRSKASIAGGISSAELFAVSV